ncbi:MltR family transcriptional regulator [Utexia brackfieldae]|uniref:MltR family transcriptional regulator n=1 Tax=Utexia brackfieldae TaxID=3074108 RepID=UPI00370DB2CA
MSKKRLQEDIILETLNQKPDIYGLLSSAIGIISKSINNLMMKAFCKEKHAIKFVIPSLVGHKGPLNELSVRLKLLYALGVISREDYEDVELLIAILDELNMDKETTYTFIDDEILGPISLLQDMIIPPNLPIKQKGTHEIGIVDSMKSSMYHQRYQQMIRASLIIAITNLATRLNQQQHVRLFS